MENPATDDGGLCETLIHDQSLLREKEAENGLRQFDFARAWIVDAVASPTVLPLSREFICELNRLAIDGIKRPAGVVRPVQVIIRNASHRPPPCEQVPEHLTHMLCYVNSRLERNLQNAIHIAAYLLWRLNWIHPFIEGNGRTSRMVSYAMLCSLSKVVLPGSNTIPDQIASLKLSDPGNSPYYSGLRHADEAWNRGEVDVSNLEIMLTEMLERQLSDYLD